MLPPEVVQISKPPNGRVPIFFQYIMRILKLLLSGTRFRRLLPHTVPSPSSLSFLPLAAPRSLLQTLLIPFRHPYKYSACVYALYVSDLYLISLCISRSEISPPAASEHGRLPRYKTIARRTCQDYFQYLSSPLVL